MPRYALFAKIKRWYRIQQLHNKWPKTFAEQVEFSRLTMESKIYRDRCNVMGKKI